MKKLFILVLAVYGTLFSVGQSNTKNNYEIDITVKPFKNQWVYLAHYFTNETKYLVDSILLNSSSKAVFKGNNESMNGGVYMIIFPGKSNYIEFIIDTNKKFGIEIDTADIKNVKFIHSPENENFYAYQKFISETKGKYQKIDGIIRSGAKIDSAAIIQNRIQEFNTINKYKRDYIKQHPTHFLSTLFLLMDGPEIPKLPNANDSLEYFRNHYWDNISFDDSKILRTPILEKKLNNYLNNLIVNNVDSMTNTAYLILEQARKDSLAYRYFLSKLAILYGNSFNPVQADAFYYIFTKYIENQKPTWVSDELYAQMQRRANFIAGNIIGNKAYDIELLDTTDNKFNIYDIRSKYVVLCFWDPICGHCLQTMPVLDSLYENNWKNKGVTMVGIYVDGGLENWKKYIANHDKNWIHGYESDSMRNALYATKKASFRQLYDIQETPIIYLLDKDKKIILKKVTPEYLNYYLEKNTPQVEAKKSSTDNSKSTKMPTKKK